MEHTLVLWLGSSNRQEEKRLPLRDTVSWAPGPEEEGGPVERDRALSCSSREITTPSPSSSVASRVYRER